MQGRLKMPMYFSVGGMDVGSGCSGFYLGSGTVLLQMDLIAGLTIRVGE